MLDSNFLLPWQMDTWQSIHQLREQNQLPHALLFTGQKGIGKVQFSQSLAHSLVCKNKETSHLPCGVCSPCKLFLSGNSPSIKEIYPEEAGKQIKIDTIRDLVNSLVLATNEGSFNIVIIHPADAMNTASANALLKTLEEPIARTLIILISDRPHLLLPTIKSRCRNIRFLSPEDKIAIEWLSSKSTGSTNIASILKENASAPLTALQAINEDWNEQLDPIFKDFTDLMNGGVEPIGISQKWSGFTDLNLLIDRLITWVMDIIRLKTSPNSPSIYNLSKRQDLQTLSKRLDLELMQLFLTQIYEFKRQLNSNLNQQLAMENLLIQWVKVSTRVSNYASA